MRQSAVTRPTGGGFGGDDFGLQECGDFKRGACFRASCKFLHNGKPAAEYVSPGIPGSTNNGAAGLPTPKAAGGFVAPDHLDHNMYDPQTGFGLFGTPVFGTRYGMIGNIPKIENVRPLCMDFFKQGFCNRRGPHNQGCLFRHDEIEGKGKIDDSGMVKKVPQIAIDAYTVEAQGHVGILSGLMGATDVKLAAAEYAKRKELQLIEEERRAKEMEERAKEMAEQAERAKAAAEAAAAAAAEAAANAPAAAAEGAPAASAEAPLPEGWKATKAPDGRFYYYHAATKKTQWTRPQAEGAADATAAAEPLPAGWKQARAPDGRTYYFAPGEKTRWTRPTEPAGGAAPAPAPAPAPADAADAADAAAAEPAAGDGDSPEAKRARVEE